MWLACMIIYQYMLTKHRQFMHKQYPAWARLPIRPMRVRRWKRLQRPHPLVKQAAPTKCAMATFLLCSNIATGLLTGMNRPRLLLCSRLGG